MVRILNDRKYVEIPGDAAFELPPLVLRSGPRMDEINELTYVAGRIVDAEALIPGAVQDALNAENLLDDSRLGLAANLIAEYRQFVEHWVWGESVLEWIHQCETSFEARPVLRKLLRPDVWPHAGRSSFVTLLEDKQATDEGIELEDAMGYRLTFRQPPPIEFFSEKFLLWLHSSLGRAAFAKWAGSFGGTDASLPPERFQFFVMSDEIREV